MRDEDLKYILIDFQATNRETGELVGKEFNLKVHVDKLRTFFQENGMEAPTFKLPSSLQQGQSSSSSSSSSPPPVENVDPKGTKKKGSGNGSGSSGGDPKKWTMKSWRPVPPAEVSNSSSSVGAASLLYQEEGAAGVDADAVAGPSDNMSDGSRSPPTLSPVSGSSPKKIRLRSSKLAVLSPMINSPAVMEEEGGGGSPIPGPSTPGPSSSRSSAAAAATAPAPESQRNGRKKRGRRGRSGNNFPNLKDSAVPLCTPPPARTKAKVVGVSAVPLNRWEKELKSEPVILEKLEKLATVWGIIMADEPVYARWSDNKFYSGVVKEKGDNDTWIIEYDDSFEAPASKSHILPIRVLGVGVKGVYTPDHCFQAKDAEIIGQKFDRDETGTTYVKYAIKIGGETEPTWCSRRQLAIKGKDGIKLRKSVKIQVVDNGGDVSLDNIVFNRRRGRKPPPEIEKKKIENIPKPREIPGKGGKSKKRQRAKDATATAPPKISPAVPAPTPTTSIASIAAVAMALCTQQALPSTSSKLAKSVSGPPPVAVAPPSPPSPVSMAALDDSSEDELLDIPLLTECHPTVRVAPRPCLAVKARVRPPSGPVQKPVAVAKPVAAAKPVVVAKPVAKIKETKGAAGKKVERKENVSEKGKELLKKKDEKDEEAESSGKDDEEAIEEEEEDGSMEDEEEDQLENVEKNEEDDEDVESIEEEQEAEEDDEGKLEIAEKREEEEDDEKQEGAIRNEEEDENNNGTDEGDDNDDDYIFENIGDDDDIIALSPKSVDVINEGDDDQESMEQEDVSDDLDEMEVDESSSSSSSSSSIIMEPISNEKKNAAPPFLKNCQGEKTKKNKKKGKMRESPPMPNIIIPLEPTPKPVKCFEGHQFYITSCDRQDQSVPSKVYDKYHTGSFNKDTLIKMIEHGGGEVLGKIGSESSDKNPFIISNCFSRTVEYLYGVAAFYPCVDRKWIAKCLEQVLAEHQKFVYWSNFTLPTGWSLEEKRVIMQHYQKPLEKKRIFMAPQNKYTEWGPIAKIGGCLNMNDIQIGPGKLLPPKVGIVIILDEEMENYKAVIAEADKRHVRVVKQEWLVQTVITGKLAPFHDPKYCILDQKTVTTKKVKKGPVTVGKTSKPPPRPSSRHSEESLLSVGGVL